VLADLIAATTPPVPAADHDTYDWLSDVWLPGLTGVASLAISAVAVWIAARSTSFAKAATLAAERSNAIAERAVAAEEARGQRAADRDERAERQAFADRFLAMLQEIVQELEDDPDWWTAPRSTPSPAMALYRSLLLESLAVGYPDFPSEPAMDMIQKAAEAHTGHYLVTQAYSYAHALVHLWVRRDSTLEGMQSFWIEQLQNAVDGKTDES
jgi:hypothetical protein